MKESQITFSSHDGQSTIYALLWEPDGKADATAAATTAAATTNATDTTATNPRGIIQIMHGASEHCARYRHFASFLTDEGFVVCADDHIGHGQSAEGPEKLGHLPVKGGLDALVEDEHELREIVAARYPADTPFVILGHSMGSFMARAYIARHGTGLAAAILSGTGQQAAGLSAFGNFAARLIARLKGPAHHSNFLHNLGMGALSQTIPEARTPFDWLSTDPAVVDAYIADEWCGMMFTVGGYATLTSLTADMVKPANAARVPKELPLLFIAGSEDPVGEKGAAVKKAAQMYRDANVSCVDVKIYEGLRHEILNEPMREVVYCDIVDWLEAHGV
jgi:alpha-beta hydrolase superfamily lysophospholipase